GRDAKGGVLLLHKPGILLGGEIAILMDRGFQKFFKTSKMEMAATAERLKAEYRFTHELDEATGGVSLYNESLGTTSDKYMYDRLKGRNSDRPTRGMFPWETAGASGGHGAAIAASKPAAVTLHPTAQPLAPRQTRCARAALPVPPTSAFDPYRRIFLLPPASCALIRAAQDNPRAAILPRPACRRSRCCVPGVR